MDEDEKYEEDYPLALDTLVCDCGNRYEDEAFVECDFCNKDICPDCMEPAEEHGGGINVQNTGLNVCTSCADKEEVEAEVLKAAEVEWERKLLDSWRTYRKQIDETETAIDKINARLKELEEKAK